MKNKYGCSECGASWGGGCHTRTCSQPWRIKWAMAWRAGRQVPFGEVPPLWLRAAQIARQRRSAEEGGVPVPRSPVLARALPLQPTQPPPALRFPPLWGVRPCSPRFRGDTMCDGSSHHVQYLPRYQMPPAEGWGLNWGARRNAVGVIGPWLGAACAGRVITMAGRP